VNCNDCASQSCQKMNSAPVIKWRLDYRKVFRLLAFISLALAWYWGQELNQPDWKKDIQNLYPKADISAISSSQTLFNMTLDDKHFYVSVATSNSFGGPLTIASTINKTGIVNSVDILRHGDTPAYIQSLKNAGYFRQFQRKNAGYTPHKGENWDAVSGATLSSDAIMRASTNASHLVAKQFFSLNPEPLQTKLSFTINHVLLMLIILLSVINIWLGNTKLKSAYIVASVVVVGFLANQMINVGNFSGLLLGFVPTLAENLGFWMLIGSVSITITVLGKNIYCGHICPFHGIQYLLHKISNLNLPLPSLVLKYGRYLPKIGLWTGLMIGLLTMNPSAGAYEPFSMIFSLQGEGIQWFIMPAVLIGSFFIPDMFCRFFCPAGEMLTLLTNVRNNLVYQVKQLLIRNKRDTL